MPTFNYKAKDRQGNTITGVVEAATPSQAAGQVREMGHLPMDIRPAGRSMPQTREAGSLLVRHFIYPIWTGVNIKHLAFFYRQLAVLLAAGMALSEALGSVRSRTRGRLGQIIEEAAVEVRGGAPMSGTLSRHPRIFSNLQLSLVRAGETGGLLESMVDRIASYLEYELEIRSRIAKILLYPLLIMVFAILAHICVPHIELAVKEGAAPFLRAVWPQMRNWIIGAVCVIVILKLIFQFNVVRFLWDSFKIQVPFIGTMARKIAMSRFSRALAILYSAGIVIGEAVVTAADASANLAVARGIKMAVPGLNAGAGITDSLAKTRMVMPMVLDMLMTGEKTGNVDETLQKVADYMDDEVDTSIHKLGIALFFAVMIAAGIIVAKVVVTFYAGLYDGMLGGL